MKASGAAIAIGDDPEDAVKGADCVVTDTWVSMGDKDGKRRHNLLKRYQVNARLMSKAKPDALFMHCLPAHRGEEVTDEVIDGPQSVVFDEAENRLHAQKGILAWCLHAGAAEARPAALAFRRSRAKYGAMTQPHIEIPVRAPANTSADDTVHAVRSGHARPARPRGAARPGGRRDPGAHAYPPPVAKLLGEAVVLTVLLGSALKIEGRFILQTQTDGPVRMLVVDFTTLATCAPARGSTRRASRPRSQTAKPTPARCSVRATSP